MDQFTEIKVIQSGTIHYKRLEVRDKPRGLATVNKLQGQVRKTYMINLHKKDEIQFGTAKGAIGPLEAIFRQLDFKPLMFGTFAESNTNVREFTETALEYGVGYLGRTIAATTVDAVRTALRRRYRTQLAMAA